MNLIAQPAFFNHCIWMFNDGPQAVDTPGESAPVIAALAAQPLLLAAILVTRPRGTARPRKKPSP